MTVKDDKIVLTIHHNLFLTRDERYKLVEREPIQVTGVCVPIWVLNKTGKSTEPGAEVFCTYEINNLEDKKKNVRKTEIGYAINLPQMPPNYVPIPPPSIERWQEMSQQDQEDWYMTRKHFVTSENLRDITDGGAEYLRFEKQRKAKLKRGPHIHVAHWIEIKPVETLNDSMMC
jgi:hypothetical protein